MKNLVGLLRSGAPFALCVFAFALISAGPVRAQGEGVRIQAVEIQYTGPQTVSRERILAQMRTKVGRNYSNSLAEQDIRALYATGQVQNVRIYGQPQGDGVKVIVAIQTRAVVNEIEISGASAISAKALRKKIKLKVNTPLDEDALGTARQEIIDAYRAKGFNEVDVQYRVDGDQARGTSRVVYTINEGGKGVVSRIRFEGNTHFSDRVLRKQMKTKPKTLISFLDKSGRLEETQLQQDVDAIREYYQDHGYIDAEVRELQRERRDGHMILVVPIVEGEKYTVGRITAKGYKNTSEEKIRLLIKMKPGDPYSPKVIREDAKKIADAYGAGGYVDLVILPQGVPSGRNQIDVNYSIEEGSRSFVQRINIVGNTRTKDKVIRREVLVAPGDIYSTTRVDTTKKRLDNLGYFSRVEAYPEETGVPGRKDLIVQVEEKRTGSLNFGAGFSTIDSIVGFVEVTQGNFDLLNWPTFTGAGQKFRARLQIGSERKDIVVALTEPYFLDRLLSLGGEAFFREANYLSSVYDQRNYGFSVLLRKPVGRFMYVSGEYRLEEIDIFNVSPSASPDIQSQAGDSSKSQIGGSFVYDSRDNPFLTRTGRRFAVTPFISGGFLGGQTQNVGVDVQAWQYFHFTKDLILLLNGQFASVENWGDGPQVKIYDRLFLGGPNDLRGWAYRDVGPKDENGEPIGGQTMLRGTIELTMPIIEKVRAAVFFDAGFIEPNPFDLGGRLASDVGLGLRLDLPVGPLRLDYGIPVQTGGNKGGAGRFSFNVGYQF